MKPPDHSYFEELAALSAGGYLSEEELREYREHSITCTECQQSEEDFAEIVELGLPLTQSSVREMYDKLRFRQQVGARERFFERARAEGIRFSPEVERPRSSSGKRGVLLASVAGASALAAAIAVVALYPRFASSRPSPPPAESQAQLQELKTENAELKAKLSAQPPADSQQAELNSLRGQLQAAVKAAEDNGRSVNELRIRAEQDATQNAQLLAELQNGEKSLENAKAELARLSQQHNEDQASTVALRTHVNDLTEQLRTSNAKVDLDRQLLAQGKDVRDLMGARQLHVVDVRDTDPSGKSGKAFGRVFLTEGKSLIFYAFDLNDAKLNDAKHTFQVWGQAGGKEASVRSLGFLYVDDKAQRRWALKVENPKLVSEIDSVFVTVEPAGGAKKPGGQRMLYAYLGEANHP